MAKVRIRCAIYTRKSTEEGLEQEFNSLDAQYEACAAYIKSQKHENWRQIKKRYDDGGVSGGTLGRPGLQALLADIGAGLVDRIVVYKIDRLTRSLSDFSKIIDRLDAASASFVSVTQSFNTATSMGRLTLHMLLSFAQFEREVTAERIRDKIAASKAKGLWMGGPAPLGYDPHPDKTVRGLVVNPEEAQQVVILFALYDQLGSLREVRDAAETKNIRSKRRTYKSGKRLGGAIMTKGQIHHILTNAIYIGKIRHKVLIYEGQHKAIVDPELWQRVQEKLQEASARHRGSGQIKSNASLKGKLFDDTGDRLTPTHTKKNGRVIRYYISNRLIHAKDSTGWRLPAIEIEGALSVAVKDHLHRILQKEFTEIEDHEAVSGKLAQINEMARFNLIQRVDLSTSKLGVTLNADACKGLFGSEFQSNFFASSLHLAKRGCGRKLILGERLPVPDATLIRTLARAHSWLARIKSGDPISAIAKSEATSESFIRTRLPLALLSPKIQKAIMTGALPPELTLSKFTKSPLPIDWIEQETLYLD
ncbi:hypothetical protein A9Q96_08385 [Rhodobacterales bacterium 52_120_T64]|nr:hypothetical protein A9Q96_08385 [Rhodobacterales bacterium 52_120_T64]